MEKSKAWGILILLVIISIMLANNDDRNTSNKKSFTESEKVKICKGFMSKLFVQPTSIMKTGLIKDQGDFVEIYYTRASDRTEWRNVCYLDGDTILWAGIFDTGLGRWRYEDEGKIRYKQDTNSVVVTGSFGHFNVNF